MALPLAGYRRLSVDRSGNKIGYEVQTIPAEGWADARGLTIGEWYEDKDKSAADEDVFREDFQRMLADVERGIWGGIVVWRVDRLVRIRYEWETTLRLVRRNGGFIASAIDGITTETDDGESMLSFQVAFGDHEVRGMKKRIRANVARRAAKGFYSGGGRRPYGFEPPIHDEEHEGLLNSGRIGVAHVPHEISLLQDAARRVAYESQTYTDVINDWHSRTPPVYGATGAPWNPKTLETILTSPRMIGKRVVGGQEVTAVWKPVLDVDTWNMLRSMTRAGVAKAPRQRYILSGRIVCNCGQPMTGALRRYRKAGVMTGTRTYRCKSGPADKARGACGSCNILAKETEMLVLARVFIRMAETRGLIEGTVEADGDIVTQIDQLELTAQSDANQLAELAQLWGKKILSTDEWASAKAPIDVRVAEARQRIDALKARLTVPTPSGPEWENLPAWFDTLTFSQKIRVVERSIARVEALPVGRSGRYFDNGRVVVTPSDSKKPGQLGDGS